MKAPNACVVSVCSDAEHDTPYTLVRHDDESGEGSATLPLLLPLAKVGRACGLPNARADGAGARPRMPPPPEPARPEAHIGAAVAYSPTTHPTTMPPDRLSLRLGQLPHDVLAELAAQLCSDSPALQAAAEECMAAHTPLPHWAVDRVLLSADLLPHLLGPLVAEDGVAAAVCTQWLAGWKATNEPRRWLKQVPLDFP